MFSEMSDYFCNEVNDNNTILPCINSFERLNYSKNNDPIHSECSEYISNMIDNIISFNNRSNPPKIEHENMSTEEMINRFKQNILNEDEKEEENKNISVIFNKEPNQYLKIKKEILGSEKENEIEQQKEENSNLSLLHILEVNKENKRKQKKLLGKKVQRPLEMKPKEKNTKEPIIKLFKTERDSQRKIQKDNYSIKLFKAINDWIIAKIQSQIPDSLSEFEINPPDYKVFTHNTNYNYIRFFLDIRYKYILQMTKIDKVILDQLFNILKIKNLKKNEYELSDEEYILAKELLKVIINNKKKVLEETDLEYLTKNEINDTDKDKIESEIIKLLINKGYKDQNEEKLQTNDIVYLDKLFFEFKLKNTRNFQNKNKTIINEIEKKTEIKELNMTLREIIIQFFSSPDFQLFYENEVKNIDISFESRNKYFLSQIYRNNNNDGYTCGFIIMVENYTKKNEKEIKNLTKYFCNKNINESEIKKYIENYSNQKNKINN